MLIYIFSKKNIVANILFRTRYIYNKEIKKEEIDEDDEDKDYYCILAINGINKSSKKYNFRKDLYRRKLRDISIYLSIMKK